MTDMQFIAISLAAVVVVGVLAYNFILDYRHSKVAQDLIKRAPHGDFKETDPLEPLEETALPVPDTLLVDPKFEWSVLLDFPNSVRPADLFDDSDTELQLILQEIHKPITWVAYDSSMEEWRFIYKGVSDFPIEHLRVNLQLCNRSGAATPEDMDAFEDFLEALALKWKAEWDVSDAPVEEIAHSMDRFCAEVDLEIIIRVLSEKSFNRDTLRSWAEGQGMEYQNQTGDYVLFHSGGGLCYRVEIAAQAGESIKSVNFVLDVPCTAHGDEVFNVMVKDAQSFAAQVEGTLVDDKNTPLLPMQLENIAAQFVALPQGKMAEIGIPAGSPQALRLFS